MAMEDTVEPPKPKKNHKVLSAIQKKHLCLLKEQNPKLTQSKLIEYATKQFGTTPSMSQINRMLISKDEFLRIRDEDGDRKRNRGAKWPQLEEAVDAWYTMVGKIQYHAFFVKRTNLLYNRITEPFILTIRPYLLQMIEHIGQLGKKCKEELLVCNMRYAFTRFATSLSIKHRIYR